MQEQAGEIDVKLGCLRGESEVFMIVEAFIFELEGISARRITDEEQGFAPVSFEAGSGSGMNI